MEARGYGLFTTWTYFAFHGRELGLYFLGFLNTRYKTAGDGKVVFLRGLQDGFHHNRGERVHSNDLYATFGDLHRDLHISHTTPVGGYYFTRGVSSFLLCCVVFRTTAMDYTASLP